MNCSGCGLDVQSDFAFCPKCGAKQPSSCPGCGYLCPPDFSFCPRCGIAIPGAAKTGAQQILSPRAPDNEAPQARVSHGSAPARPESVADRRTVTVLFADLCGFTALSEQLDPEVMQALQNELFEDLTTAVHGFGGFVDKFIGDALLALFGAPVAHEDDPERALRAALDMINRTARMADRWKTRTGSTLVLHLGINTGPVVTGGFGVGTSKSYSVTGDTVNSAQRLQSIAKPGEVLVGPLTYRLTRHAFSYESLGDHALRGKVGSFPVHRLICPLEAPRAARGLEALGLSAPLIGRNAELQRMLGCLELACCGTAQLVRLVGEAGIGKSRLTETFLARVNEDARFAELVVRRAYCSSLGEPSYGALAAVLRSAYEIDPADSPEKTKELLAAGLCGLGLSSEEVSQLTPLLFYVLGLDDKEQMLRHVEPEQLRRQIFYAVRTIFERRLARSPLLLVVEDLHWADTASLEVLRFLMDRLERSRLMLLTTHRSAFDTDVLDSSRTSLTVLRLAPLSDDDGRKLLAAFFGFEPSKLSIDLTNRILERAGGNPLFLEEIVRGLVETGALQRDGQHWRIATKEAAADIPVNIEAMLLARMDRLLPDVRRLAQEAAVIGPRFDARLLRTISTDPTHVDAGLDLLCDAEIIEEIPRTETTASHDYRFMQTLLHGVIYQNLLLQRRVEMHGQIGDALERLYGNEPEHLEDLALLGHHFSQTPARAKGALYLMAAGDRARKIYANDDALRLYGLALGALSNADQGQDFLLLCERIADLCGPAGQRETAKAYYMQALKAYRGTGDPAATARILRKLGRLLWDMGKRDEAEARYAEATTLLEGMDPLIEHAHLAQERGHLAFRVGDQDSAVRWADEALHCAQILASGSDAETRLEAARVTAEALNTKAVALARLGRSQDAVRDVERSVKVAEDAGLLNVACRGYTNLGVLYTIANPQLAIQVCRRGLKVAHRIGDLGFQARLLANLAVAYCTFTDRCASEGVPAAEKAIEIDRALDQRDHLPVPLIVLGQIHQCHGQPELARDCYREALAVAGETREPQLLFPCYDGLATLSLDLDDMAEAERYFTLAQDVCTRHGLDPEALIVLPFLD
ncbi:MAG: adenylate/guanylate cyclase domain-containing protein [Phyllobacterium sp.]|uniref:adenylate/guanylate cyclase domain-containing protein n=1 Tax=Phyllobacterium sp. TaxID=1871046 RepID=UPI0030F24205